MSDCNYKKGQEAERKLCFLSASTVFTNNSKITWKIITRLEAKYER